jgi:hypothetical protein
LLTCLGVAMRGSGDRLQLSAPLVAVQDDSGSDLACELRIFLDGSADGFEVTRDQIERVSERPSRVE